METAGPSANFLLFVMDDFELGKGSYKLAREVKEESKEGMRNHHCLSFFAFLAVFDYREFLAYCCINWILRFFRVF